MPRAHSQLRLQLNFIRFKGFQPPLSSGLFTGWMMLELRFIVFQMKRPEDKDGKKPLNLMKVSWRPQLRLKLNLKVQDLAVRFEISKTSISHYVIFHKRNITFAKIHSFCHPNGVGLINQYLSTPNTKTNPLKRNIIHCM